LERFVKAGRRRKPKILSNRLNAFAPCLKVPNGNVPAQGIFDRLKGCAV
jgi:hypothetical protein